MIQTHSNLKLGVAGVNSSQNTTYFDLKINVTREKRCIERKKKSTKETVLLFCKLCCSLLLLQAPKCFIIMRPISLKKTCWLARLRFI